MKTDRITGTLHEDQYTFFIISHSVLLRMRNVSESKSKQSEITHFVFNYGFFFSEIVGVYEVKCINTSIV